MLFRSIVAYKAATNTVYVVECKSYLDSIGVRASAFDGSNLKAARLYKLFNEPVLREVVFERLCKQLFKAGACHDNPRVQLALACGKIKNETDRKELGARFEENNWKLWDEAWIKEGIRKMADQGYENQVASVVAKMMLRE